MKIKILTQTKNYVIAHKPSGFLVYAESPKEEVLSLQTFLQEQLNRKVYPVHRLDKQTDGLIIYAFSKEGADKLRKVFQSKSVEKTYLAFCHDHFTEERIRVDAPLKKNKQKVTEKAVTIIEPVQNIDIELRGEKRKYSVVMCYPETGRFHQIRRHLRHIKHPIVGDSIYGNSWNNEAFQEEFRVDRTLLSAITLKFQDPWSKQNILVKTKLDFDFANLLNSLNVKVNF